jgi:putative redox protein
VKVSARRRKGYAHSLTSGRHTLIADEPAEKGGADTGPDPVDLLAVSLAACTAITIEMYAERKGWELHDVEVEVDHDLKKPGPATFQVLIRLPTSLPDEQLERLRAIAAKCPVHRTLLGDVEIIDTIERVEAS